MGSCVFCLVKKADTFQHLRKHFKNWEATAEIVCGLAKQMSFLLLDTPNSRSIRIEI